MTDRIAVLGPLFATPGPLPAVDAVTVVLVSSAVSLTAGRLAKRSRCLALALQREGAQPGDTVGIACCAEHADDLLVALSAVLEVGAIPCVMSTCRTSSGSTARASKVPALVLACEEGDAQLIRARISTRVIGNAARVGVSWWKALECRAAGMQRRDGSTVDPSATLARLGHLRVANLLALGTGADIVPVATAPAHVTRSIPVRMLLDAASPTTEWYEPRAPDFFGAAAAI